MQYETPDLMVRVQDHVTIIRFRSEALTSSVDIQRLTESLEGIISDGARLLILDFKNVRQIGSAGLGMMIGIQKMLKELSGQMAISHAENIQDLLRVSHTARLFDLHADSREAFKKLRPY
jgi:anti-anti-sigma factor